VIAAADADPWRRRVRTAGGVQDLVKLRQEADLDAMDPESLLLLALRLFRSGESAQAADLARDVQSRHPNHVAVNELAGLFAGERSPPRHDEALRFFTAAAALRPKSAESQYNVGVALANVGDRELALNAHRRSIRLRPDSARGHHAVADLLYQMGHKQEAMVHYRETVRLEPQRYAAHVQIGNLLLEEGDEDAALAEYREAIRLDPDSPGAHISLGRLLFLLGKIDAAIVEYRRVVTLQPESDVAHERLARALLMKDDLDGGIAEAREAIRLNPDSVRAHFYLAWGLQRRGAALRDAGLGEEAIAAQREASAHFDRASALDPRDVNRASAHAWFLCFQADPPVRDAARAVTIAREATAIDPRNGLGDAAEARIWFDKAVAWARTPRGKHDLTTDTHDLTAVWREAARTLGAEGPPADTRHAPERR
jgi:tetratricopeptide (TPR) repeat protein